MISVSPAYRSPHPLYNPTSVSPSRCRHHILYISNMIPARQLTYLQYRKEFPRGGKGPPPPSAPKNKSRHSNGTANDPGRNIINDVPLAAKSFLIYKHSILKEYEGDGTFPIPEGDEFQDLRQLETLRAVVKEIDCGKSIFSHMWVSPGDVRKILGKDFMEKLELIQKLVRSTAI